MSVSPISFEICICVQIPETGGDRHRTPICLHKNKRRLLSQFPAKTTASCCDVSSKKNHPSDLRLPKHFCFCLGYPIGRVLLGLLQWPLISCYFKNNLFCLLLYRYVLVTQPPSRSGQVHSNLDGSCLTRHLIVKLHLLSSFPHFSATKKDAYLLRNAENKRP